MGIFSALMVIVACHAQGADCVNEPLLVRSFEYSDQCRAALDRELAKARRADFLVYGDCVPVEAALLAGRGPIERVIDPRTLAGEAATARNGQALAIAGGGAGN